MNQTTFNDMHPQDRAIHFQKLEQVDKIKLLQNTESLIIAEFFEHLLFEEMVNIIETYEREHLIEILNLMDSDEVSDVFRELNPALRISLLQEIDKKHADAIREILQYDPNQAGGLMEKQFFYIRSKFTAGKCLEFLLEQAPKIGNISYIYVVENDYKLLGIISLKELILLDKNEKLIDHMQKTIKAVYVDTPANEVAQMFLDYDFYAMPVVNQAFEMQGIITVDDVLDIMQELSDSQLEQVTGAEAEQGTIMQAITSRIPWLLILLCFSIINSRIYGSFDVIRIAAIASFMPLIGGMAGNVGTQSLGLIIRKIAYEKDFVRQSKLVLSYVLKELRTYIGISIITSIIAIIVAYTLYNNITIALILGLTILATFSLSTLLGILIPVALEKMNINSSIASGPLISTLNDLIAISIYLTIATFVVNYIKVF